MTILAQSIFDPTAQVVEKVVGGSILFAVGWLVIRWTFRLLREVRDIAADDRAASVEREKIAAEREKLLLEQLSNQGKINAELNAQLFTERQMRTALEKSGLTERRRNGTAEYEGIEQRGTGREGTD